jgi:hypothetical protein
LDKVIRIRSAIFLFCAALASAVLVAAAVVSFAQNDAEKTPVEKAPAEQTPAEKAQKTYLNEDQCYVCHRDDDNLPEHFDDEDTHIQPGLSCAGCHGGDPTSDDPDVAMSEKAGFVGVPSKADIPQFCGRCHSDIGFMRRFQPRIPTDQVSQYFTSLHGQRLLEGDRKVADCTSCHSSHEILPAHDARSSVYPLNVPATCNRCHGDAKYMAGYGIPTNQYEKYAKSVHGVALLENEDTGAPACNDCHGNHGALPPEVTSIAQVCGQCHVNNMQYFEASTMAEAFAKENLVGCEECHGNHGVQRTSDAMVGIGSESVCTDCHEAGDKGYKAAEAIHKELQGLVTVYEAAVAKKEEVQRKGMDDVEIGFLLQESHQNLIKARTLVHTFDPEKVGSQTGEGVKKAEQALRLSAETIEDFYFRRRGFGLATLFITLLVVALFFKIRQMEGK